MGELLEVLFTSTLNNDHASCSVHDLRTGTDLMKYKGGGSMQPHSLQVLGANYVLAANSMKPLLHVWPINGQEQMSTIRFVVPGKVNALALSPDGVYLVAGIQESIYIWHMTTGRMLNTLNKHYQPITCLRFTDNGEHFASAGKDGAVLVWNLTQAISPLEQGNDNDANDPFYSFNDHGLTVTDVHIGCGGLRAYMYTVSLDRCCKIYDLSSGTLLLTVVFPVALHSVLVNALETSVYVGSSEGQVHIFNLAKVPRMKEYHLEEDKTLSFVGHESGLPITCLALSLNGQQLISGGEDKKVCIWHVGTRQLIKTLPQLGAVTNLKLRLTNPAIFQPEHKQPQLFADSLKRMISAADDDECIELLISEECSLQPIAPKRRLNDSYDGEIEEETASANGQKNGVEEIAEENDDSQAEIEKEEVDSEAEVEVEDETDEEREDDGIEEIEDDDSEEIEDDDSEEVEDDDSEEVEDEEDDEEEVEIPAQPIKAQKSKTDSKNVANGSCKLVDGQAKSLLAENARLKSESRRMFEIMFKYIANNPKQATTSTTAKAAKKARKN